MSQSIEVNSQNFDKEVLQSDLPVLVDFWAPWCQPCLLMAPALESIADEMQDKIRIAKLNTEIPENLNLAGQYQIRSIPNMKLFYKGEIIREFIGLRPKEALQQELEEILKNIQTSKN
jgi:thioredoxin 1